MSVRISPVRPAQSRQWWTFAYKLDGVTFTVRYQWQERNASWYLTVIDPDGNDLVSSRRLSSGYPVLKRLKTDGLPPGYLWLLPTDGGEYEPDFDQFGNEGAMTYTPEDEI